MKNRRVPDSPRVPLLKLSYVCARACSYVSPLKLVLTRAACKSDSDCAFQPCVNVDDTMTHTLHSLQKDPLRGRTLMHLSDQICEEYMVRFGIRL